MRSISTALDYVAIGAKMEKRGGGAEHAHAHVHVHVPVHEHVWHAKRCHVHHCTRTSEVDFNAKVIFVPCYFEQAQTSIRYGPRKHQIMESEVLNMDYGNVLGQDMPHSSPKATNEGTRQPSR